MAMKRRAHSAQVAGAVWFAESSAARAGEYYVLRLFVAGATPRSIQAVKTVRALCEEILPGRYELEVVDIYQQPALAGEDQIVAAPTLLKKSPLPLRRLIGDMSDRTRLLHGLALVLPALGAATPVP